MSELPQRLRFVRAQRMVKRGDFQRAFAQGARARGDALIVVAVPNGLAHARLGLSVGRAIWKSAVKRNRVRRVFRESFRLEQAALPAGFDLVLIPARAALEPELAAVRAELVRLSRKAVEKHRAKQARDAAAGAERAP